jgi:hypothetical protein
MRHRRCLLLLVLAAALPAASAAQSSRPAVAPPSAKWTAPRTPDGAPDLQGVWLIHTATPLERPKALEGKARLTDDEVAEFRRRAERLFKSGNSDFAVGDGVFQAVLGNAERYTNPNATHGANEMIDIEFDNRTSLIVDPQDGRIPTLTPEGRQRQTMTAAAAQRPSAPVDVGNTNRCLSWGVPRLGGRYGSGDLAYYQIVQAPGVVVLYMEAGHETRVIPTDNRPHLASSLRQLNGDSRGHWEGDTLVVDTTNFSRGSYFMGSTENLHLVERFTRIASDTITYTIEISDSSTWTRPWTAMLPMRQRHETLYEYACHEGNYHLMRGMLDGARVQREAESR